MRETLDKRPIIIRRAQEISVTLRSVPTIVTARTFCAFRDFPRGTRGLTFIYFRSDPRTVAHNGNTQIDIILLHSLS